MRKVWLASYPKSGNTWMRMLIAALSLKDGEPLDINNLPENNDIASARRPFDDLTLIPSGLLTHDEIEALRPVVHEAQLHGGEIDEGGHADLPRFVKIHDAYTYLPGGEPLLGGIDGADGIVLIVRDPRGVAPSLADHRGINLDSAIAQLNDPNTVDGILAGRQDRQLPQRLMDWSQHVRSWLCQSDIPVHLVRYEDMIADTAEVLVGVLRFSGCPATRDRIERAVSLSKFSALRVREAATGFAETSSKSSGGWFFRRGEALAWRDELTKDQIARLEAAHGAMMSELGYMLDGAVEPRHGSGTIAASDLAAPADPGRSDEPMWGARQ